MGNCMATSTVRLRMNTTIATMMAVLPLVLLLAITADGALPDACINYPCYHRRRAGGPNIGPPPDSCASHSCAHRRRSTGFAAASSGGMAGRHIRRRYDPAGDGGMRRRRTVDACFG